ncbi:MAG: NAD(P)-binding domain-containing protein [Akkermansiaceae bacterium]|nr:NAD(P)-binding domain-containing protein [Akkermansiaceae bacterium]
MKNDFSKITILGGGLLGGSLTLALAAMGDDAPQVSLWARSEHTVTTARDLGISNITADLAEAVKDAKWSSSRFLSARWRLSFLRLWKQACRMAV